jgi:hypothetical protein
MEPYLVQSGKALGDSASGHRLFQGKKLRLAGGVAPGPPGIARPPPQPVLIVTLSVQDQLRALLGSGFDPFHEVGILLERPFPVPVGYDEKRRSQAAVPAELPELANVLFVSRADVVNGDQQHH